MFNEMGLDPNILKAIEEIGFSVPTPVQEKSIPLLLQGQTDLIANAQTGTGKTAAFGLPVIQQTDTNLHNTQALILCPTRELCMQIAGDLAKFSKYLPQISVVPVYGGASIHVQIRNLDKGAHIVVATPGRAIDLLNHKKLNINNIRWLILDEADEMLSMGFREDLETIISKAPVSRQTMLFSATLSPEILSIASRYLVNPVEVSVGKKNAGADNVSHIYHLVHARDRYEALKRIADVNPKIYGIVFCRTRAEAKEVADNLIRDGYNADALHGDLSQDQRDIVMNRFRIRHLQLLVATDVAARGLDVNDLTHIINYDLPDDPEIYIHRSGRTGRAGRKGITFSIIHLKEKGKLKQIEKMLGKKIDYKPVPTGKEICEKQLFNLVDRVENVEINTDLTDDYLKVIFQKLEWLDREDLIRHFISVEFNRFLASYENAPDLNIDTEPSFGKETNGKFRNEGKMSRSKGNYSESGTFSERKVRRNKNISFSRFFLNAGKNDQLDKRSIIDIINRQLPGKSVEIGEIEILRNFSFVEVDNRYDRDIHLAFGKAKFNGKRIGLETARPKNG